MPEELCKLCPMNKDLQNSHGLSRSLFKKLRSQGKGNNDPCIVTAREFRRSSGQYTDYVFCKKCEKRFNDGGEDYVMRMLPTPKKPGFPLLEILDNAQPFRQGDGWKAYRAIETPGSTGLSSPISQSAYSGVRRSIPGPQRTATRSALISVVSTTKR
jgi:hypothetical protein